MSLVLKDRVHETTNTTGTADVVLAGAVEGFQTFLAGVGDGNTTYYTIKNSTQWEVGKGTYTQSTNTLSRDTVLASSNSGSKISMSGGSDIFVTYPADKSVFIDTDGYLTAQSLTGIKFADGSTQTYATHLTGTGSSGVVPYWTSSTGFGYDSNLSWNSAHTQLTNKKLTKLSPSTGLPLALSRGSAGNVFHGYVDNDGKAIGLHLTDAASPTWTLGLKNISDADTVVPSQEYAYGGNSSVGMYAASDSAFIMNYSNGFWVRHKGMDLVNAGKTAGFVLSNQVAASVGMQIKSAIGQSANIQEWQTSVGTVLTAIDKTGAVVFNTQIAKDDAPNSSFFYESASGTLAFKNSVGSTSYWGGGGGGGVVYTAGSGLNLNGDEFDAITATTSVAGITTLSNTINSDQDKALTPKAVKDAGFIASETWPYASGSVVSGVAFSAYTGTGDIFIDEYIKHTGDTNTYIRFRGDQMDFVAGNVTMLTLDETTNDKVKINDGGNDIDFQVEGKNDSNLIRTDAANDRVGIGTDTPAYKLDVTGTDAWIRSTGVIVGNSGVVLSDNVPSVTDYTLYRDGSTLKWNGSSIGAGGTETFNHASGVIVSGIATTAHSWGDHASAGYLTSETSHTDVVVDGDFSTNGLLKRTGAGAYTSVTDNSSNWDTAYGWGNHTSAGYLTSETFTSLVQDTSPQLGGTLDANTQSIDMGTNTITDTKVGYWDTAYGWGDHGSAGYLTSQTSHADVVIDGDFGSEGLMKRGGSAGTYSIVTDNSTNWDTAYGWGNHASAGYSSTDTTYTAGSGLELHGTTFEVGVSGDNLIATNSPTDNYVPSYDSATGKFTWVVNAGGGGGINNVVEDATPQLGGDLDANGNDIDMGTNVITDAKVGYWDTAYGWGDHGSAGYLSTETFPYASGSTVSGIATTAHGWGDHASAGYAPTASPTFTGTPAAPTAAAATNTTQVATTAFVRTEVSNLVASAPATLDTLNELAAAINDDADFSTTITNSIATKIGNVVEDTSPQLGGQLDANGQSIDMGTNTITDTKVGYWDTAYGWGDHGSAGYLSTETFPYASGAIVSGIATTAHGWGNHASAGYLTSQTSHADVLVDGDFGSAGLMKTDGAGTYSIVTDSSTNWNTAYGWGDHGSAGYLTASSTNTLTNKSGNISQWTNDSSYLTSETFPYASGSVVSGIATTAHGWGNHASAGYLTSETFTSLVQDTTPQLGGTLDANSNSIDMGTNTITDTKVGQWDTAYGWGNHASAGYLTSHGLTFGIADDNAVEIDHASVADNDYAKFTANGLEGRSYSEVLSDIGAQASDAGLTSIAGLTTAADKMIYTTASDTYAVTSLTSAARGLLDDASASDMRTTLGLAIGSDVQAYDADLAAIAGLTSAADKGIQFTGAGTASTYDLTAAGKALLDDADAAAQRTTLGVAIGSDVQAYDADLAAIAGLTSAADKGIQFTGAGTAATYDLTTAGKALLDDADAAAQRTTLGLGSVATKTYNATMGDNANIPDGAAIKAYGDANWAGAASAGGSNTQIQFNDSTALGGDADLTWNKTTNVMTINGHLAASTKSFLIDHPTKPEKKLQYACLEGPENGVYIRGYADNNIIELPEYWVELVDPDSITVHLTPKSFLQPYIYVNSVSDNKIHLISDRDISVFYTVNATRRDVAPLEVEV